MSYRKVYSKLGKHLLYFATLIRKINNTKILSFFIIARLRAIVKINLLIYYFYMEVRLVLVYDKLWQTMKEKGVSQYALIKQYGFSTGQLDRLRKNDNVNSFTLNRLCEILQCRLEDIAEYQKN